MGNVLNQQQQERIRSLGSLGWSLRRIQEATGVRRETISRYLHAAGIRVRKPRQRRLPPDPKAASQVTTDSVRNSKAASQVTVDLERPGQEGQPSKCEPYREAIEEAIRLGRNATAIWQDLTTEHGFEASYESVKRFVRKLKGSAAREAHPTIQTEPGEEGQVDYGTGPMVRCGKTNKYKRTRLFVFTLGCSRKSVWLLAFKSGSRIWSELHEEAFRRLGGVPNVVVLDNLKEGVVKPDIYDPEINPIYGSMLQHYGVTAIPARVRHPDRKGKVERAVGHAQETALKGKRFESLEEAQAHLDQWASRWADTRFHGTMKRQVAVMFEEEKPFLKPLPLAPFKYFEYGVRTVHLDGCIEVEAAYYSAPPGWIGKRVDVQWDGVWVRIMNPKTGELLRESRKKPRGYREIHPDDKPRKTPPTTVNLLARANRAGKSIGALCTEIHERREEGGIRQILGVLSLAKKHSAEALEDACNFAIASGSPTYRFVRRWIERNPPVPVTLRQVDPLIRELTLYRDIINQQEENRK